MFKEPGILQLKFERPELNGITAQAKQAFTRLSGNTKKFSFVYSPDAYFVGLMENSLPTFWSPALSRASASTTRDVPTMRWDTGHHGRYS